MTPEQFAYWLQGFVELNPSMAQPTPEQWKAIGEHLQTVFRKVTPPVQVPPGPFVAAPSREMTPIEKIQDAFNRNPHLRMPQSDTGLVDFSRGGQHPGGLAYC